MQTTPKTHPGAASGRRIVLAAALLYVGVAAAFFAPLGPKLVTSLVGEGDNLGTIWNAWWLSRAFTQLENPFFTDLLFAPMGTPLVWHSLAPIPSLTVALLSSAMRIEAAYNATMIAALPLAGLGAFLLARRISGDGPASIAGGLVFMLSPFLVSKTLGHIDLVYAALLPFWTLALLAALDDADTPGARRGAWVLGALSMITLFGASPNVPIFAANAAFWLFVAEALRARREGRPQPWRTTARRFALLLRPTLLLALPYVALVVWYSISWLYPPNALDSLDYNPELLSLLLPATKTSLYSNLVAGMGLRALDGVEAAAYLGVGVLPISVAGLYLGRRLPRVRWLGFLLLLYTACALGPKLLWDREVVEVAGLPVYLPFGLWRWVPVLGWVGQAGRYMVLAYLAMAVGFALAVSVLRTRGGALGRAALPAAIAIVCADYAFEPRSSEAPPPLSLSPEGPERRRVLDPRLGSAATMYHQTLHGRPLVGGYLSRPPPWPLRYYREDPALRWLFFPDEYDAPDRDRLIESLRIHRVGDVLLDPGDPRGGVLLRYGFETRGTGPFTSVFSRP